jgi:hypothetical protein
VLEGVNGWRLPTASEMSATLWMTSSLKPCPVCNPGVDQSAFNDTLPVMGATDVAYQSNTYSNSASGWEDMDYCYGFNGGVLTDTAMFRCIHDPLP